MKHLIVYAHPNPASLNAHFKNTVMETLLAKGDEVLVRDLYAQNFNPVFSLADLQAQRTGSHSDDIKREQEYIAWADTITFVYPIWWTGLPAMLKG